MKARAPEVITDGLTLFDVSVNHKDKRLVYDYRCDVSYSDLSSSEKNEFRQLLSTMASGLASSAYRVFRSDKMFLKFDYTQSYRFYSSFNGALISSFDVGYSSYSKAQVGQNNPSTGKVKQFIDEYSGNHIKFSGVPVTGNIYDFSRKLVGFSRISSANGVFRLEGSFVGKRCQLYLHETPVSHTVYLISAIFMRKTKWRELKSDYLTLKKSLTEKYGSPYETKEEFRSPYKEGDGRESFAFDDGKATWYSKFRVEGGEIVLFIRNQGSTEMTVILKYTDTINSKLNDKETLDVI